jgi:hypothetical protein
MQYLKDGPFPEFAALDTLLGLDLGVIPPCDELLSVEANIPTQLGQIATACPNLKYVGYAHYEEKRPVLVLSRNSTGELRSWTHNYNITLLTAWRHLGQPWYDV